MAAAAAAAPAAKKRRLLPHQDHDLDSRSSPQQQQQQEAAAEEADVDQELWQDLPTDAEFAITSMRAQLKAVAPALPPVVLQSHLYAVLKDRTRTDREIESLRASGRLRVFKLGTDTDEYAVLLTDDYLALARSAAAGGHDGDGQQRAAAAANAAAAVETFLAHVVPACKGVSVERDELLQLHWDARAAAGSAHARPPSSQPAAAPGKASEDFVSTLMARELLSRDAVTPGLLTFTIPGAGAFVSQLAAGRQELLALVGKRRYREALEKELLTRKLRRSCLGVRYHIRDAVCRGSLVRSDTPGGPVVRLARRGGAQLQPP